MAGRKRGYTLPEIMVVAAILALLVSMLLPAVFSAKEAARLAACQVTAKGLGAALWLYVAENGGYFPPFAFSSAVQPDLLLSGHWGGSRNPADPDLFGRFPDEMASLNLHRLTGKGFVAPAGLLCPGAPAELRSGEAGFFPGTDQFSTYCLRFPPSEDLFAEAPGLRTSAKGSPHVLAVYRFAAGGHWEYVPAGPGRGATREMVPLVHGEQMYRTAAGLYDPACSALLADAFWMPAYAAPAPAPAARRVLRTRCHGKKYNVLFGHGGVVSAVDDGTVQDTAVPPGQSPAGSAPYYEAAEILWSFFDAVR